MTMRLLRSHDQKQKYGAILVGLLLRRPLNKTEKSELLQRIEAALDTEKDSFALVRLNARGSVRTLGIAVAPSNPDFFYVD